MGTERLPDCFHMSSALLIHFGSFVLPPAQPPATFTTPSTLFPSRASVTPLKRYMCFLSFSRASVTPLKRYRTFLSSYRASVTLLKRYVFLSSSRASVTPLKRHKCFLSFSRASVTPLKIYGCMFYPPPAVFRIRIH
jgi:hypothetical protein